MKTLIRNIGQIASGDLHRPLLEDVEPLEDLLRLLEERRAAVHELLRLAARDRALERVARGHRAREQQQSPTPPHGGIVAFQAAAEGASSATNPS